MPSLRELVKNEKEAYKAYLQARDDLAEARMRWRKAQRDLHGEIENVKE